MATKMQEIMFAHVQAWQSSEMTMKAFAQSIGVTKDKFEYWLKKYRRIFEVKNDAPAFIQLEAPITKPKSQQKSTDLPKLAMELSLPSGLCLKIYN